MSEWKSYAGPTSGARWGDAGCTGYTVEVYEDVGGRTRDHTSVRLDGGELIVSHHTGRHDGGDVDVCLELSAEQWRALAAACERMAEAAPGPHYPDGVLFADVADVDPMEAP